jgi:glycosyltransferase involved in cell wall biosynthesis
MLRRALRHVDAFIFPSEFTRRRHHVGAGLDIPIVFIPNCGDHDAEEPAPPEAMDTVSLPARPFFLFVGRLERLKGLQTVLTVLPLFRDGGEADLVVAGDGDYAGELRRLAAGCERIHFLGRLTPAQLRGVYARAIAIVVPSITFETFGQVIIKAYAARTPVIVRDLGPMPEIVAESGGGLVFRDDASLRDAMDRLRADPALRAALGQAGYRTYRSPLDGRGPPGALPGADPRHPG